MFDVAHAGFIIAAYAICVVVIGGLIASITLEHRRLKRALDAFGGARRGEDATP